MAEFLGDANLIRGSVESAVASTPLGALPLRAGTGPSAGRRSRSVLIRPEQVEIWPGRGVQGLAGRVAESHFHGHDTVMRILPDASSGISCIVARTDGGLALAPGTEVTVTARGPVLAWPDDG